MLIITLGTLTAGTFCIVTEDNAAIRKHYRSSKQINMKNKFLRGFLLGKESSGWEQMLDPNNPDKKIGWIQKENILCGNELSTDDPFMEARKLKTIDGKDSVLHKKAFIVNTIFSGKTVNGKALSKVVNLPRYTSATNSSTTGKYSNLYELYYVLDEKNDRYLLTRSEILFAKPYQNNIDETIIGWVEKDHAKLWKSRVAIEPMRDDMNAYLNKELSPKAKYNIHGLKIDIPKNYFSLRYPLLEQYNNAIKISYMQNENKYSKIRKMNSSVLSQNKKYIVFLLDATIGMQAYMNNVKTAIRQYLDKKSDSQLEVAIALYRDYSDEDGKYELITGKFVSPKKAISLMYGGFFKESSKNDSVGLVGEDRAYLEALFNGIISVARDRRLSLSEHPGVRIVLIGDHGNHRADRDDNGYRASDVVSELGRTVTLDVIQVHTNELIRYVQKFKADIDEIHRLGINGKFMRDNTGSPTTINTEIGHATREIKHLKKLAIKVVSGIELTEDEKKFYKDNLGIDLDNYAKVQQSVELYIPHSQLRKYKKMLLVQEEQLRALIAAYDNMASTISRYTGAGGESRKLRRGLSESIETLTGEEIGRDKNVAKFLEEKLKIPKSPLLDLSFHEWVEAIVTNTRPVNKNKGKKVKSSKGKLTYRAVLIRNFRKYSTKLQALTNQRIYENIRFNKRNQVMYDTKRDANGRFVTKKTKFTISMISKHTNKSVYDSEMWIWVPFDYLR